MCSFFNSYMDSKIEFILFKYTIRYTGPELSNIDFMFSILIA